MIGKRADSEEKEFNMKKEKQIELLKKLIRFVNDSGDKTNKVPREIMQEIANEVANIINPLQPPLVPFYIAAFEYTAASLRARFTEEAELANELKQAFNCATVVFERRKK